MTIQIRKTASIHITRRTIVLEDIWIRSPASLNSIGDPLINGLLLVNGDGEEALGGFGGIIDVAVGADKHLETSVGMDHEAHVLVGGGEEEGFGLVV